MERPELGTVGPEVSGLEAPSVIPRARWLTFVVNSERVSIAVDPQTRLLYILRNDLRLNGPKFGCGLGECGACSVLIDGRLARSCVVPIERVEGREVTTLEGLGTRQNPSIVQSAFIAEQAAQCGYCLNGMIMTAHALVHANPNVSAAQAAAALRHNLCRCGTHVEILRAVMLSAARVRQTAP